jgi:hypothetical protein
MMFSSVILSACARKPLTPGLVSTSELGTVRTLHFVRAVTHFHTPYSFDACDGKGVSADGTLNRSCLSDAKTAFCDNHINFVFATDHSNHLSEYSFSDLALIEAGDTLLTKAGLPVGNQMTCADGFQPVLAVGLEGKFLALGMERHVPGDAAARDAVYTSDSADSFTKLAGTYAGPDPGPWPNALVGIPHTESRDTASLIALAPNFIEIYNVHANLDPRIRKKYLGRSPFDLVAVFINYLADPYHSLYADYMFSDYLEFNRVYFEKWNALLAANIPVTGVGGLDSHQNIFSQKGSDGLRLDHHRRMTRSFSNLVLTASDTIDGVKGAIAAGRVYFVVEGLGTPVGMDFRGVTVHDNGNGTSTETIHEMGSTMTVNAPDASILRFSVPSVHPAFPGMDSGERPEVRSELVRVDASGAESVVASSGTSTLVYSNPPAGHYRVHVYMRPKHLEEFFFDGDRVRQSFNWIISNHIKVQHLP